MCVNFQARQGTLTFLVQICPKLDLELKIEKTKVGIKTSILGILCESIFRQNGQLLLFWPKFVQK